MPAALVLPSSVIGIRKVEEQCGVAANFSKAAHEADDETLNSLFVTTAGNSAASSVEGYGTEDRALSSMAPGIDAASLHEHLQSDSSPASVSFRRTSPAPSSSAQSSQQADNFATQACVCGDVACNDQLRIPVTTAHEGPEQSLKGFTRPCSATKQCISTSESSRISSKTRVPVSTSDDESRSAPTWLANPETQTAVLEMLDEEVVAAINPAYMDLHSHTMVPDGQCITPAMRHMTITWMSEAMYVLELDQRVFSMAVNLLDRYLSASRQFPRTMLQLAAASAIFIASKIEGVLPHPRASRVASLSDGAFDLDRLIDFERVMCHTLGFDLYSPSTQNFLDMWIHMLPGPATEPESFFFDSFRNLASYILELGLLVYKTLCYKRSVLATAALLLALGDPGLHHGVASALQVHPDSIRSHAHSLVANLRCYIGPHTDLVDVTAAASELLKLLRLTCIKEHRRHFIFSKFSSARFDYIAEVSRPLAPSDFHKFMHIYYSCTP